MTIAQKMTLLLVSSIGSLAALILVSSQHASEIHHIQAQLQLIEQLRVSALSMRRDEKDFFQRLKEEYSEKHTKNYDQFTQQLAQLDNALVGDTTSISSQVSHYRNDFVKTVALQKVIGLTSETGLYGELRAAVHNVEKKFQPITTTAAGAKLLADVLLLRRHEKDFMLRRDAKYADNLMRDVKTLETDLAKSPLDDEDIAKLQGLVDVYKSSFSTLVENEKLIGIKDVKGLHDSMRTQAHQMEESLSAFVKNTNNQAEIIKKNGFWLNVYLSAGVVLFLVGMTWYTRRSVLVPVNGLMQQMQNITATGKLQNRVAVYAQDELGEMAHSFNLLLENMNSVINETNQVIGELAQGRLGERMTGVYVGDLAQLASNVNTSVDAISNITEQLKDAMDALYNGQFDRSIDVTAPGQFGQMLTSSANGLSALRSVLYELNQLASAMKLGDFERRIESEARGDLLVMKSNINAALNDLDGAVKEVNTVMTAQSTGDLAERVKGAYQGQLKQLSNAINTSADQLQQIVSKVVLSAHIVNEGANQVSQGANDLATRIQEQASAIEESSATIHEMSTSVSTNTHNATLVANLTRTVESSSQEGVAVMQQTIEAIQGIQASSQQIAEIIGIIDNIAFQTNLLALNAAVEAARAGEHGRGFAVVASEVRGLAAKSALAAKDIKTLINASVSRIKTGTRLADKSGEMLQQISLSIGQVAVMVEDMTRASEEQNAAIIQVSGAMSEIDRATQENAALVEETTAAADNLNDEADALRNNMKYFKGIKRTT